MSAGGPSLMKRPPVITGSVAFSGQGENLMGPTAASGHPTTPSTRLTVFQSPRHMPCLTTTPAALQ